MKKVLFTVLALSAMVMSIRAEVATLKHGDQLTVFYTTNALKDALNAAETGDIINLSSGFFNISTINKAVTIIGAGMETDTENNIAATILTNGYLSISLRQEDPEATLRFEGVCFNSLVSSTGSNSSQVYGLTVTRCKFGEYFYASNELYHAQFINCIFYGPSRNNFRGTSSFINSYIENVDYYGTCSYLNCVVGLNSYPSDYENHAFMNCIIIKHSNGNSSYLQNVENCIATRGSTSYSSYPISGKSGYTCEQIFKTYRLTSSDGYNYTEGERFELTDEGKQILGIDGTEIGMQGGYIPYDPTPTNIQIERCTVDKQTDENGKLNVSIKLREKKTDEDTTEHPTE